ncbi:aminotransferase class V-fold PLP-dependent enzyme [Devosia sp. 2618]|uniref:aminotransferase class V-fold PLP-dependent enzyme n=1 Tax=Devosia sp. 2618 TaxID=3156454 RepID=UPI00339A6388
MTSLTWNPLLDIPPFPVYGYAKLADRIGALLGTRHDVLLVQGEAIIALEAVATSLARPGLQALNVVTSPYGGLFGDWLSRGGAAVSNVIAAPGLPITIATFTAALDAMPGVGVVALVHAESASGILNPLEDIATLAKARGAVVVVDAVASVGGHELNTDALGLDIVVIGAQKSLGGSAGLSALSVSPTAWGLIAQPGGVEQSTLSLLDLKHNWLDRGRLALPGMPSALEFHALAGALDRFEAEGLDNAIARHARAAAATRDGVEALGLPLWVEASGASNLMTGVQIPQSIEINSLLRELAPFDTCIGPGVGLIADRLVRLNHTGNRARLDAVLANVLALGQALQQLGHPTDLGAASAAVLRHYGRPA